jgi:hypothetical protein
LQQQGELVTAQPGHGVSRPGTTEQALANRHQELVADLMAESVVDRLEAVEIEIQQPHSLPDRPRADDRAAQILHQSGSVDESSQRVVERLVGDVIDEAAVLERGDGQGRRTGQAVEQVGVWVQALGSLVDGGDDET